MTPNCFIVTTRMILCVVNEKLARERERNDLFNRF